MGDGRSRRRALGSGKEIRDTVTHELLGAVGFGLSRGILGRGHGVASALCRIVQPELAFVRVRWRVMSRQKSGRYVAVLVVVE
jgi:hypothetical protein